MANPLTVVSDWVPNILNPKILFITENYPGEPNNIEKRANNRFIIVIDYNLFRR